MIIIEEQRGVLLLLVLLCGFVLVIGNIGIFLIIASADCSSCNNPFNMIELDVKVNYFLTMARSNISYFVDKSPVV